MGRGLGPVAKGISRLPVEPRSLPRRGEPGRVRNSKQLDFGKEF